jgi:uncharacterized protein (DUF983 family)
MPQTPCHTEVSLRLAVKRGVLGRCPNCGQAALFKSYLEQFPNCPACGAELFRVRADDVAPWLTIIIIGHVFLPLILFVNLSTFMPFWLGVACWAVLFSGIALLVLPRAKGLIIGVLWVTRSPESFDQDATSA